MRPQKLALLFFFIVLSVLSFTFALAQTTPNVYTGKIDSATPFTEIGFSIPRATTITIDHKATSGDLDAYLYLLDNNGKIIAENDDASRGNPDSRIHGIFVPAGNYTIIATRYDVMRGKTAGDFEVTITYDAEQQERITYDLSEQALIEAGYPPIDPKPKATWTVLVYYGGDSTLEASLMSDFVEFERAGGSSDEVRIIGILDRYGWKSENGGWTGTRLYELGNNRTGDFGQVEIPTIDSTHLVDFGDLNTGSGETLARFLAWGIQTYPADHYILAFGGHGGGWRGVITDDTSKSIITLPELDAALTEVKRLTGISQFDLVVNDACLMGNVEYYDVMSRHFAYSLASPEIVIDPALDMTLLTELIRQKETLDISKLGEPLVETYIQRDILRDRRPDARYMSFASTKLDEMANVRRSIETFARLVNQDPLTYAPILGVARANTYTFAKFLGSDNDYDVDLGHFMQQIVLHSNDAPLITAARDVLRALEDARLYANAADYARLYTSYYSIYFPRRSRDFDTNYYTYTPYRQWAEMLANYFNSTMPRLWSREDSVLTYHPPMRPEVTITQTYPQLASAQTPPVLGIEVVGRGLSQGQFTVDRVLENGDKIRLMTTPIVTEVTVANTVDLVNTWKSGVDLSYLQWLPFSLPVVSDGTAQHHELLIKTGDLAALAGRFRLPHTEFWIDVAVLFNREGVVEQVIARSDTPGIIAPITIPQGAEFQAYTFLVMPDGEVKPQPGNLYTWGERGIVFADLEVNAGEYELGVLVKTFSGISGFASTTLTVAQPDPALRDVAGYTDLALGITYQHPAEWGTVFDNSDALFITSPAQDMEIMVYRFPMTDDLAQIRDIFGRAYGARITGATVLSALPVPASQFDVVWDNRPGWTGRGIALHRQTANGDMAIVFMVNSRVGNINRIFTQLRDSIRLFDIPESTASWQYDKFSNGLAYPVPIDWTSTEADGWRIYAPADEANTFFGVTRIRATDPQAVLSDLMTEFAPNAVDIQRRDYFAENRTWHVAGFSQNVNGQAVAGRIYTTLIDGRVYAVRMQAPSDEAVASRYRTIFEPVVDGFAPRLTAIIADAGTLSTYIKATLAQARVTCADLPLNSLCIGAGTVSATYPQADNLRRFAKALMPNLSDTTIQSLDALSVLDVGLLEDGTIDPFSLAILNLQANLPDDSPGLTIAVFGGMTIENRTPAGAPMSIFEVFMNGSPKNPKLVNGILFLAPPDKPVTLVINDVQFEFAPGAVMFWREETNTIEQTTTEGDRAGVVPIVSKRRPGVWSTQILKGILRARGTGTFANNVATGVAGTSIKFDGAFEIGEMVNADNDFLNKIIGFKPDFMILPPITPLDLDKLLNNQNLLANAPLDDDLTLDELLELLLSLSLLRLPEVTNPDDDVEEIVLTEEALIAPETTPLVPIFGLSASDVECPVGTVMTHTATYTSNDGATLTSAEAMGFGVSVSVLGVSANVVSLEILCPAFPDGYPIDVLGTDSFGRSVSATFWVGVFGGGGATFDANPASCNVGQTIFITASYNHLEYTIASIEDYGIDETSAVFTGLPAQIITFGYAVQAQINCTSVGTDNFFFEILDTNGDTYIAWGTVTVSAPPPPNPTLTGPTTYACEVGQFGYILYTFTPDGGESFGFYMGASAIPAGVITAITQSAINATTYIANFFCNAVGTTTLYYDISTIPGDIFLSVSVEVTVNPAPPPPTPVFTLSGPFECDEGDTVVVSGTMTDGTLQSFDSMSIADTNIATDAGGANIVGNTLKTNVNCVLRGLTNITVYVRDTNNDLYADTSTVRVVGPPYFSGGTSHDCTVGDQVTMNFEYLEWEGGNTLTGATANAFGDVSIDSISIINGNMLVQVIVNCDNVGAGTVDLYADTSSARFPTVDVTGIVVTVNP